jgi:uroporphyrinogen decarboxylase
MVVYILSLQSALVKVTCPACALFTTEILRAPPHRQGRQRMKHRERVEIALNHETPDRCPLQVSFTPEFASRLKREMGLTDTDLHNPHGGGNTYKLERLLGEDLLLTSVGWANSYYGESGETYTDEWGVTWKHVPYETPYGNGTYTEMRTTLRSPLTDLQIPPDQNCMSKRRV